MSVRKYLEPFQFLAMPGTRSVVGRTRCQTGRGRAGFSTIAGTKIKRLRGRWVTLSRWEKPCPNSPPPKTDRAYLDWNATAPLRPQARAAMVAALDAIGNPSSVHAEGREARGIVEAARESVALLVGAEPRHVV